MREHYNENELIQEKKLSPMLREYVNVKIKYPDCIVAYRCGDFYESYFNDALTLNKYFGLKASGKSCGLDEDAPMCGFPIRAATLHFNRFLQSGYKIVIVEQTEDPKNAKGRLVNREIVRILTPGTVIDEDMLMTNNNYLASIIKDDKQVGFSYVDISTGEVYASILDFSTLKEEIARIRPVEMLIPDEVAKLMVLPTATLHDLNINSSFDEIDNDILKQYFDVHYLKQLSLPTLAIKSLAQLLSYVFYAQKKISKNINSINFYDVHKTMLIDGFTRESLELTHKIHSNDKKDSLFDILDKTKTAMGARKLRQRIEQPYLEKRVIEERLDFVEEFFDNMVLTSSVRQQLNNVYDIERICGRLAFERISPKEMIQLRNSLQNLPKIKEMIQKANVPKLQNYISKMDTLEDLYDLIFRAIANEPKTNITEGEIIKTGYNNIVDKYRDTLLHISERLDKLRMEEKNKWGSTVKIVQNDTDGYYLEITKRQLAQINLPAEYTRLKELSNSVRFMFPALKEMQADKLEALSKNNILENKLFCEVRDELIENIDRLKKTASLIAELDMFMSLATVASINNYVKPQLNEEHYMHIEGGRHPVIEQVSSEEFVSNDLKMNQDEFIYVITGPNMSGKSTYMRQMALITLMAQIGSFVPCTKANIAICDRIFTRIGASDNLSEGESTFMVEMNELSQILNNATNRSLCLLDEIGRGTSMFDGISIAKASIQYLAEKVHCFTLFSTHYFELIDMENNYSCIQNYKVDVLEMNDDLLFLRKVVKGSSTQSYGIHVAKMAGMPLEVTNNAKKILNELETGKSVLSIIDEEYKEEIEEDSISDKIKSLDLNNMTPIEVFLYVSELQKKGD